MPAKVNKFSVGIAMKEGQKKYLDLARQGIRVAISQFSNLEKLFGNNTNKP